MTDIAIADPVLGERERERVVEVLDEGALADGPLVRQFEREFAADVRAEHAVATSNGTTALHTALHALGVGEGDVVVTSPFSFVASANAVRFCGATPVFADVDPETFNLDPDDVERVLRERGGDVAAIMPVHLYGLPADLDALADLAEEYDCRLVEDACQAHGARYRGEPVGAVGDAGCFSFYPTKNMTTGEGGMIVTDDESVADAASRFVNHGRTGAYDHATLGHNFRLTSVAAAIGLCQLEKLPRFVDARRAHAAALTDRLADVPGVRTPAEPSHCRHSYHQYTVRATDRDGLRDHLDEEGIGAGIYYPVTIPDQPAYHGTSAAVPTARAATDEVLSLPVHPSLDRADVERIADAVGAYYE